MREIPYNRIAAVLYARRWGNARNPAYYNFDELGGDCTNFASQSMELFNNSCFAKIWCL